MSNTRVHAAVPFFVFAFVIGLGGCSVLPPTEVSSQPLSQASTDLKERECLIRAMYFESNRSSDDGLSAVGTVVMNRAASPNYPHTLCGVVGQPGQFAYGVLSHPMNEAERARVDRVADDILAGKRNKKVGGAMYFHLAGLHFGFRNMHYVLVAGGNAFYEKRSITHDAPAAAPPISDQPSTVVPNDALAYAPAAHAAASSEDPAPAPESQESKK